MENFNKKKKTKGFFFTLSYNEGIFRSREWIFPHFNPEN